MTKIRFWKIVRRQVWVYRKQWYSNITTDILSPIIQLLAFGLGLGSFIGTISGFSYLTFIVPGIVAGSAVSMATGNCTYGAYIRADYQKTYDMQLSTPLTLGDIILAEIVSASIFAIISSSFVMVISFLFGVVPNWELLVIPLLSFVIALVAGPIALTFTGRVYNINNFAIYFEMVVVPLSFLSGAYFPITILPAGLQIAVQLFPLYHVITAMRLAFFGTLTIGPVLVAVVISAAWAVPFFFLAQRAFAQRIIP